MSDSGRPLDGPESLAGQRRALATWWKGGQAEPLFLARRDTHWVSEVLFPTLSDRLRRDARWAWATLLGLAPPSAVKVAGYRLLGVRIGRDVFIAPRVFIDPLFPWLVEIGARACLGLGCTLAAHEYTAAGFRIARVRVGADSVIGGFATLRSGVRVGDAVTVGAHSFVNRDVPDGATVGGVPARRLGSKG